MGRGGAADSYFGQAAAQAMPLFVGGQRVRLPQSASELVRAHPPLEVSQPTGAAGREPTSLLHWGPAEAGPREVR